MASTESDVFDTVATGLFAGLNTLVLFQLMVLAVIASLAREASDAVFFYFFAAFGGSSLIALFPLWRAARQRSRHKCANGILSVMLPSSILGFIWNALLLLVHGGFLRWEF